MLRESVKMTEPGIQDKWLGAIEYKNLGPMIKSRVSVTTMDNARIVDSQLDELLTDTELMHFIDGMCLESDVPLPDYIAFLIRTINAAYNASYPANLELEDRKYKDAAINMRKHLSERPSIKDFLELVREYAVRGYAVEYRP